MTIICWVVATLPWGGKGEREPIKVEKNDKFQSISLSITFPFKKSSQSVGEGVRVRVHFWTNCIISDQFKNESDSVYNEYNLQKRLCTLKRVLCVLRELSTTTRLRPELQFEFNAPSTLH